MPKRVLMRWLFVLMMLVMVLAACQNDDGGDDAAATAVPPTSISDGSSSVSVQARPTTGARPTLPPSFDVDSTGSTETIAANAGFRLIHGVEDLPAFDVLLNDAVVYRSVMAGHVTLAINQPGGEYELILSESTAGRVRTGDEEIYYNGNILLEDDITLLFLFTGSRDNVQVQVLEENLDVLEPDQARLVVVNALTDVDNLNVQSDRQELTDPIASGERSTPIVLRPDTYQVDFLDGETFLATEDLALENGMSYLLVVYGTAADTQILHVASATPPRTRFRVVHAAPDTIPFQLRLNGDIVAQSLSFGESTDFTLLPSGQYFAEIYLISPDGVVDDLPVQTHNVQLEDFTTVELAVFGPDIDLAIDTFSIDTTPIQTGQSRVMFVHVGFGQGRLRTQNLSGEDLGINLNYGSAQTMNFIPSRQNFFFIDPNTSEVVEQLRDFTLEPATVSTYFVTARQNQPPVIAGVNIVEQGSFVEETVSMDVSSTTRVTVYNAWDETIAINFNEERIALGLAPDALSDPALFAPLTTLIEVLNTDGNLLFEKTVFLDANGPNDYRLYVVPFGAGIELVLMTDDVSPVEDGYARLQIVHALAAYDQLAMAWGDDQLVQMFFSSANEAFLVESGDITFNIIDRAGGELLFSQVVTIQEGVNYRLVITEDNAGMPILLVLEN